MYQLTPNNFKSRSRRRSNKPLQRYIAKPRSALLTSGDERILEVTKNLFTATVVGPVGVAADVLGSLVFKASDLPEISSYSNLYEQYRFIKISVKFVPQLMLTPVATNVGSHPLLVAIDYNNNGTPPNLNSLLDYTNLKITPPMQPLTITLRPHSLALMYDGTTNQVSGNQPAQWINTSQTGITHYGLRYGIKSSGLASNTNQVWTVYSTYTIQFKGTF